MHAAGILGNTGDTINTIIDNCYSIGEDITSDSNASILGSWWVPGVKVDNCYYLDTSDLSGLGNDYLGTLETNNIYKKSLSDFTLPVTDNNSVSYLLNENNTSGLWGQDDKINDGLPYLLNCKNVGGNK